MVDNIFPSDSLDYCAGGGSQICGSQSFRGSPMMRLSPGVSINSTSASTAIHKTLE